MPFKNAIGFFVKPVSGVTYDPDLLTYIDGLITPLSAGQLALLNTMLLYWKAGLGITNLSDADDVIYCLAGETAESSLRNMVKRSHDATAVNAPTFTALEGFTGDGISGYLDTGYQPSGDGVNFSQNDCSMGVYFRSWVDSFSYAAGVTRYRRVGILPRSAGDDGLVWLNQASSVSYCQDILEGTGFTIGSRDGATSIDVYHNKTVQHGTSISGETPKVYDAYILCVNELGVPTSIIEGQCSLCFFGRSMSQAQVEAFEDAFEAYMDANGKGVIA